MHLLLDAHIFLWAVAEKERLPRPLKEKLLLPSTTLYVSMVSLWELAIKENIGKLPLPPYFFQNLETANLTVLPLELSHIEIYRQLPVGSHRDPFDRMLVAQAMAENLTIVTNDAALKSYSVRVMDA